MELRHCRNIVLLNFKDTTRTKFIFVGTGAFDVPDRTSGFHIRPNEKFQKINNNNFLIFFQKTY